MTEIYVPMKKVYAIRIISKLSKRFVCHFYVKAYTIADAAVYAYNNLVPDLLEASVISEVNLERVSLEGYEIYEAD